MHDARIEPDQLSFQRVIRALDDESDGRELRRDLADGFHDILDDVVDLQRSGLMGMATGGLQHAGEPLRTAISDRLEVDVRLGGRSAGARIRARKHGMPRSFFNAPKRTNARQWRRQIFGRDIWITQISGAENWFDGPVDAAAPRYRAAARRALGNVAQRIDRKT